MEKHEDNKEKSKESKHRNPALNVSSPQIKIKTQFTRDKENESK